MMQLSIEVPLIFPIIGILIILIFGFFLYRINENLNQIKKLNFIKTDDINNQKEYVKKEEQEINSDDLIVSPMVGIVYLSPDPAKPPFVTEGDHVKQGDTIALIEAMKTFNNVSAPRSGVIKKILITSGKPAEYGEKLMIIE